MRSVPQKPQPQCKLTRYSSPQLQRFLTAAAFWSGYYDQCRCNVTGESNAVRAQAYENVKEVKNFRREVKAILRERGAWTFAGCTEESKANMAGQWHYREMTK